MCEHVCVCKRAGRCVYIGRKECESVCMNVEAHEQAVETCRRACKRAGRCVCGMCVNVDRHLQACGRCLSM